MEWHGEHLPLGQDVLKVEKFCEIISENRRRYPPDNIRRPFNSTAERHLHTLEYSRSIVQNLALELLQ